MTVKEFYERINGDYRDIQSRLSSDALIMRFVRLFPSDGTYRELMAAVEKYDTEAAFEAAHKLKGIAANLSFSELYIASSRLCEQLRPLSGAIDMSLVHKVSESYQTVLNEIKHMEDSRVQQ